MWITEKDFAAGLAKSAVRDAVDLCRVLLYTLLICRKHTNLKSAKEQDRTDFLPAARPKRARKSWFEEGEKAGLNSRSSLDFT
jgi:hypothetical protein